MREPEHRDVVVQRAIGRASRAVEVGVDVDLHDRHAEGGPIAACIEVEGERAGEDGAPDHVRRSQRVLRCDENCGVDLGPVAREAAYPGEG
jgi:hypothetical protein